MSQHLVETNFVSFRTKETSSSSPSMSHNTGQEHRTQVITAPGPVLATQLARRLGAGCLDTWTGTENSNEWADVSPKCVCLGMIRLNTSPEFSVCLPAVLTFSWPKPLPRFVLAGKPRAKWEGRSWTPIQLLPAIMKTSHQESEVLRRWSRMKKHARWCESTAPLLQWRT